VNRFALDFEMCQDTCDIGRCVFGRHEPSSAYIPNCRNDFLAAGVLCASSFHGFRA
jgi:hypothetical protein